ncbi:unnamed protein product [Pedinophyceae sp. YPF-701]|nr:unnamed protein product [Pedinophyceae sp. YPF-701]
MWSMHDTDAAASPELAAKGPRPLSASPVDWDATQAPHGPRRPAASRSGHVARASAPFGTRLDTVCENGMVFHPRPKCIRRLGKQHSAVLDALPDAETDGADPILADERPSAVTDNSAETPASCVIISGAVVPVPPSGALDATWLSQALAAKEKVSLCVRTSRGEAGCTDGLGLPVTPITPWPLELHTVLASVGDRTSQASGDDAHEAVAPRRRSSLKVADVSLRPRRTFVAIGGCSIPVSSDGMVPVMMGSRNSDFQCGRGNSGDGGEDGAATRARLRVAHSHSHLGSLSEGVESHPGLPEGFPRVGLTENAGDAKGAPRMSGESGATNSVACSRLKRDHASTRRYELFRSQTTDSGNTQSATEPFRRMPRSMEVVRNRSTLEVDAPRETMAHAARADARSSRMMERVHPVGVADVPEPRRRFGCFCF